MDTPESFYDNVLAILLDNPTQLRAESALWNLARGVPYEVACHLTREWKAERLTGYLVADRLWSEMPVSNRTRWAEEER